MNNFALNEHIKQLRARDPMIAVTFNPGKTAIAMLRGRLSNPVNVEVLARSPYDYARRFIRENRVLLNDIDEVTALVNERVMTDRQGMTHVIFAQKHGNAEVLGGNITVHYSADGAVYLINSTLASLIDVPDSPRIGSDRAVEIAKDHAGPGSVPFNDMPPALVIVDAKSLHKEREAKKYYLCWQIRVVPSAFGGSTDSVYLIDAIDGQVLLQYSALQTVGTGHYSNGTALNSEASGGTFRLRDTVTSSAWSATTKPFIHTYDDANTASLSLRNYSEDTNDNWDNGGAVPANRFDDQRAEVDLHRFLGYVLDYYYQTHGHNSWDGAGADVRGHVHNMYDPGGKIGMPNNAFWDPGTQELYFGDGNGTTRDFFTVLDTTAHEFTHGVNTGFGVVQNYDGETGALNEAISDLFGAFIVQGHAGDDPWPWHHGRQYRLDGTVGRNMIDPSREESGAVRYDATTDATKKTSCRNGFYPDHYTIRYTATDDPNDNDNHGVHWNCPIITHAVYLMINGGTHRLSGITVTGIGVAPIEQILYHVISTGLLDNTSDFAKFRLAFISACKDLYSGNMGHLLTVKTAFYAVGIGPDLGMRFIVERSTLGEDEINARRAAPGSGGTAVVPEAFRIVVDGFSAAEIGISGRDDHLPVNYSADGITIQPKGNIDSGGYEADEQRFTFHYDLDFGSTNDAFSFPDSTKSIELKVEILSHNLSASALIELIKQPNPFILHGDPPWLSIDLRVFVVREGKTIFGVPAIGNDASDAPRFIQDVMKALTDGKGAAGGQSFDDPNVLSPDEEASSLYVHPTDENGENVFNFALAKVRYIGEIGAENVRVFFRLFQAQSTNTAYDIPPNDNYPMVGSYRFWSDGVQGGKKVPLAGINEDKEYVTIPCLAAARIDSTAYSMVDQPDDPNVQTFTVDANGSDIEVDRFYGCWLDINQPSKKVLPIQAISGDEDGPFTTAYSIHDAIMRNKHQCLIAEIAFDPVEIPMDVDPSNWDKLAQRNIAWSDIGSAQALSTFEIRPTPLEAIQSGQMPDELMIDWGNTPSGSLAKIYLPEVSATDILTMADRMYTTHWLELADSRTIQCLTGGITYIPIPPGRDVNYAGLLSVELPETVQRDEVFNIVVRQVTNASGRIPLPSVRSAKSVGSAVVTESIEWRRVLGAFQLTIPVHSKEDLLAPEERLLSVFRWIERIIPEDNRWYFVFNRYVAQIANRVDAFGGDSTKVAASPTGEWEEAYRNCRLLTFATVLLIVLFLIGIGVLTGNFRMLFGTLIFALLSGTVRFWMKNCRPTRCQMLRALLAGTAIGTIILALLFVLGSATPQLVNTLITSAGITFVSAVVSWVRGCFN